MHKNVFAAGEPTEEAYMNPRISSWINGGGREAAQRWSRKWLWTCNSRWWIQQIASDNLHHIRRRVARWHRVLYKLVLTQLVTYLHPYLLSDLLTCTMHYAYARHTLHYELWSVQFPCIGETSHLEHAADSCQKTLTSEPRLRIFHYVTWCQSAT